jgi:hypothetical protein
MNDEDEDEDALDDEEDEDEAEAERRKKAFIKICGSYDPKRPMTRELTVLVFMEVKQCSRADAEEYVEEFMRQNPHLGFLQA